VAAVRWSGRRRGDQNGAGLVSDDLGRPDQVLGDLALGDRVLDDLALDDLGGLNFEGAGLSAA